MCYTLLYFKLFSEKNDKFVIKISEVKMMKSLLMHIQGERFDDKLLNLKIDVDKQYINWMEFLKQQYEFLKLFINNKLIIESNSFRDEKIELNTNRKVEETTRQLIDKTSNI